LGYLPRPSPLDEPIIAPNGAAFRRSRGILPGILDDLVPRRAKAVAEGDKVASHAIKILMNSFYGVLGTPACRFAAPELANAITGFGRELLLWSKERMERYGRRVIYGDTDSLFVLSGKEDVSEAKAAGHRLAKRLNRELSKHIQARWGVESRLELRFERLYLRFFLPSVRHGTAGARKRYAGLAEKNGGTEVVFTGMEAVRRDWTELARQVQREIYRLLFTGHPVEEYLKQIVREVREGRADELLVYRKAVRKDLDTYVASTPPHVAAARKATEHRGSLVAYVITRSGPEPAEERKSAIDYEHYVQKQVRAVAEPVLDLLKIDFNRVVGDDTQMRLF
jgi:DNA polymerase-2